MNAHWKRLRHFAKVFAWRVTDKLVLLSATRLDDGSALLVRADAIGDFILWFPEAEALIAELRKQGKRITLVAGSAWAAWGAQLGLVDEVIAFDRARFDRDLRYRYQLGRTVRQKGFTLAVQPTYSRVWHSGDTLVRVSGARERIGSVGDPETDSPAQRRRSNRWFTRLIPALEGTVWEPEQNIYFLKQFLGREERERRTLARSFRFALPEDFRAERKDRAYYVLFPGASEPGKRWPVAAFREIARKVYAATGWLGVICGGPEDRGLATALLEGCAAPVLPWAGRTDLSALAAILAEARFLVTNDTSASHLAATMGTPSVCVLGGGHFGRFHPYPPPRTADEPKTLSVYHPMSCFNCDWKCIYTVPIDAPKPCISEINIESVWTAVLEIVDSAKARA